MLGNNPFLDPLENDDIDAYMTPDRFVMQNGVIDFTYLNFDFDRNHSFGNSNVMAYYLMADYELNKRIRLTGGVRLEQTDIFTDVDKYYREGYERNDPRRLNVGGFPFVNAASIQETNLLPNISLVYKVPSEKWLQTNLRFNYSQSLARPSIRELSDAAIYDNEFRTLIYGNSDLKMAYVTNYDFRGETYLKNGDHYSFSLFYKTFENHIEMGFGSAGITWENIQQSNVSGIELECKKSITKNLELRANVTLVKSNSQFVRRDFQTIDGIKDYTIIDTLNRAMFGQAPYLINGILSYRADSLGITATVSYNVQGPRLVIAGAVKGRADVFELPRHTIDFKLSKVLSEHFTASIAVRDVLNAPIRRSYDLPEGWVDYDNFRFGTNFQIGVTYKL
jgi:outer membrane receptor protein involved in Fe transport